MNKTSIILFVMSLFVLTACQDKDIDRDAMVLQAPDASQITGSLTGDDYTWTWPSHKPFEGCSEKLHPRGSHKYQWRADATGG